MKKLLLLAALLPEKGGNGAHEVHGNGNGKSHKH
jgi:hypothetical protein